MLYLLIIHRKKLIHGSSSHQQWRNLTPSIVSFLQDLNRSADELMSAWQPQRTVLGGLFKISFIMLKPGPLGTFFITYNILLY